MEEFNQHQKWLSLQLSTSQVILLKSMLSFQFKTKLIKSKNKEHKLSMESTISCILLDQIKKSTALLSLKGLILTMVAPSLKLESVITNTNMDMEILSITFILIILSINQSDYLQKNIDKILITIFRYWFRK